MIDNRRAELKVTGTFTFAEFRPGRLEGGETTLPGVFGTNRAPGALKEVAATWAYMKRCQKRWTAFFAAFKQIRKQTLSSLP